MIKVGKEKKDSKASKGLGNLYGGGLAMKRREWRGLKDTMYDYGRWLKLYGDLGKIAMQSPVQLSKALFRYRWMSSYISAPAFIDRHTIGLRGAQLKMSRLQWDLVMKHGFETITTLAKADQNIGGSKKLSDKIVLFDEMMMIQIMCGFPNLIGIPYQLMPVFMCSEIDQQSMIAYLDSIENFGLPADVCPLPAAEAGCAVENDYPKLGKCFIASTMPCDGSVMTTSYQDRRLGLPTYSLTLPVRYLDPEAEECAVEDIKGCIRFIEEQTGEKFDWDAYFSCMRRFNEETEMEMEKWEINRTPYPQLTGPNLALYRMYLYQVEGGRDERFLDVYKKVMKLMNEGYEKKRPCSKEMRHRAIVWSCPAHYYSNFSSWAENCWGINVLLDMEAMNSVRIFDCEDKEQSLKDLAHLYERMTMRKHTNGGYVNLLDELWRVCEYFNVDMVLMYSHISCKTMAGLQGLFEDQARERGIRLIWIEHDLLDPRTVSRRTMRGKVNQYMRTVMREEPLDPTLEDFEDENNW